MSKHFQHPTAIVEAGANIGQGTRIWHFCHIMGGAQIGEFSSLGQNVFVANNAVIGNHCKIQNNVSVYEGVKLEDYVFCGPSMVFTNVKNPRAGFPRNSGEHYLTTVVKKGASIGANATIVCGVTIGEFAFVGAGAVVTENVPAYAVVAGVSAEPLGWMCECGETLEFKADKACCSLCGCKYVMKAENDVCQESKGW